MVMKRVVAYSVNIVMLLLSLPAVAAAQGIGAVSIVGVVKDSSGGVMPGVTVEAASPVLIERSRATVTDAQGRYQIAELRPGTYSVTFTLTGFATFKRDGLTLTPGFVATINADLRLGALSETVLVTADSPLVDTRTAAKVTVISDQTLNALPTSKSIGSMLAFVPGAVSPANGVDTGGTKGEQSVRISVYGANPNDMRQMTNGMQYTNLFGDGGGRLYFVNPITVEQDAIDLGAPGTAQYEFAGAVINTIPREGGNKFSGLVFGAFTNHSLQSSNLNSDLQAQGVTTVNGVREIWDSSALFGGPIVKDKWWFTTSGRYSGSTLRASSLFHDANAGLSPTNPAYWTYAPDPNNPVDPEERNRNVQFRTTFQVGSKDKIGASTDIQRHFRDQAFGQLDQGIAKIEANASMCHIDSLTQFTWSRPQSNKLLFEGGGTVGLNTFGTTNFGTAIDGSDYSPCGQAIPFHVNIADPARGPAYHGVGAIGAGNVSNQFNGRFATSYVTGAHNFKVGYQILRGNVTANTIHRADDVGGLPISYGFTNGVPTSMTLFASGISDAHLKWDMGTFAQDSWSMKRVTLNLGMRFDWLEARTGDVTEPANALFGSYSAAAVDNRPNWKDFSPRIGAVWDVFGDGKTAIKGGINRYVAGASTNTAALFGPGATASTTRTWTDSNKNFFPDCDLKNALAQNLSASGGDICGAYATPSVGTFTASTSVPDSSYTDGWGKRFYNWRTMATLEQQIGSNLAVAATYAHTIYGGFTVTDNLNLSPTDFDPYCVTLPNDPRLLRSGQQLCGLWDQRISPATSNLVTFSDNYVGKYSIPGATQAQSAQTQHFNGFDLSATARLPRTSTLNFGWSIGNTIQNTAVSANGGQINTSSTNCLVVDSPQQLTNQVQPCVVNTPYQSRFRVNGSFQLPWGGVQLAAVYQDLPGPMIAANFTFTSAAINAQPTGGLGRNLRLATVTMDILPPFSMFGDRFRQLDFRATKTVQMGSRRIQLNLDVYNLLNASAATFIQNTYSAPGAVTATPWLSPTQVQDGRFAKVSAQLFF
jgi:hypothetical protein